MEMNKPQSIYLSDYQPYPFLIKHIDLEFQLDSVKTQVKNTLEIIPNPQVPASEKLFLFGEDILLNKVSVNHQIVSPNDYSLTEKGLTIPVPADTPSTVIIESECCPESNSELSGLYVSSSLLITQCEAEGFRRITFFPDRPDVLTIFSTKLIAKKERYPILLSNGNLVGKGDLEHGMHWVKWHDPYPKPCYLFALVAGELSCLSDSYKTMSGREVSLKIYADKKHIKACDYAMQAVKRAMSWDEKNFGREYDLDTYMIVAVEDFNSGAMENKGLNIFNAKYILVEKETAIDQDFQNVEAVIGHEYFHNWTGNRVTCRDWFQLSLKEGLTIFREQSFSADMWGHAISRIQEVKRLRSEQFPQDASAMAHPVQPDHYIEIGNFYTVTIYEKGAEVIRMLQRMFGIDGFRKGMDVYFQRHDGQAVTINDFVSAIAETNHFDAKQFFNWYKQAGTPEIFISLEYQQETKQTVLTVEQLCPPTPNQPTKEPFYIPMAISFIDRAGESIDFSCQQSLPANNPNELILPITEKKQRFVIDNVPFDAVPSLFRGFSAPAKYHFPFTKKDILHLIKYDSDAFVCWDAMQTLFLSVCRQLITDQQSKKAFQLDNDLIAIIQSILNNQAMDKMMVAELISLPSEKYLIEMLADASLSSIIDVHKFLHESLAKALKDKLVNTYQENVILNGYRVDKQDIAARTLKNVCLNYLTALQQDDMINIAVKQFYDADNMTDRFAAITALIDVNCDERKLILDAFYNQYKNNNLVIDMWYAAQARSRLPNTVTLMKTLLQDEKFNWHNPNRIYASVGVFARQNTVGFHALDGSGYTFLSEAVLKIDQINPQVAARMAEPFTRIARLDKVRQKLMHEKLTLMQQEKLSKDLYEIIALSLNN